MAPWHSINTTAPLPSPDATSFKLSTPPKKDIWRASPTWDVFDAPFLYQKVKKSAFQRLQLTVSGPWKTQFDQGGFMLVFPSPGQPASKGKWIKAGIEFFKGEPKIGVVGTDVFSDWSLYPMPAGQEGEGTFEAVIEEGSLWLYFVARDGERHPLREVRWAFQEGDEEGAEMWVGAYAAKPTVESDGEEKGIEVEFRDFEVVTR